MGFALVFQGIDNYWNGGEAMGGSPSASKGSMHGADSNLPAAAAASWWQPHAEGPGSQTLQHPICKCGRESKALYIISDWAVDGDGSGEVSSRCAAELERRIQCPGRTAGSFARIAAKETCPGRPGPSWLVDSGGRAAYLRQQYVCSG